MNETIKTQLSHRSIRQFTGEPVPADKLDAILEVGMRTSSSRGFQHAALIRVTNPEQKAKIAAISTQGYLADAPELFIGIVDARRSYRILEEKRGRYQASTVGGGLPRRLY